MPDHPDPHLEKLEAEKSRLETQVNELRARIWTINNLIYQHKSGIVAQSQDEFINRKNADRFYYEAVILDLLNKTEKGLRTAQIHRQMEKAGYELNYNTLRSYVAKMRDKNLIRKLTPRDYRWVAVE